jgi:hypothetical protein
MIGQPQLQEIKGNANPNAHCFGQEEGKLRYYKRNGASCTWLNKRFHCPQHSSATGVEATKEGWRVSHQTSLIIKEISNNLETGTMHLPAYLHCRCAAAKGYVIFFTNHCIGSLTTFLELH